MIFKKHERRRLPMAVALTVGGLAALGIYTVKQKGQQICRSMRTKMKKAFTAKKQECDVINMDDFE